MQMKKRKVEAGSSWKIDETYIKIEQWCYLYRALDRTQHN
ncbi:DDE-type integrase/transposase/recombinase [Flavobacterium anhuiense]